MSNQLKITNRSPSSKSLDVDLGQQLTNDPLAHIFCYQQTGSWAVLDRQINAELLTDLAERSQQAFVSTCQFEVSGDDLISETNLSLRQLLHKGVETARQDIANLGSDYGYKREMARLHEVDDLLDWYKQGSPGILMVNSLCPAATEITPEIADKLNFRPERQMSSNVFYQLKQGRIEAHYFSLDDHSLSRHNQLLEQLGLSPRLGSSLDILATSLQLKSVVELQTALRTVFGEQDVFELDDSTQDKIQISYKAISQEVAKALKAGRVSRQLGRLATSYCLDLSAGQSYDPQQARQDMDKMRAQVMPHYAFNPQTDNISAAAQQATADKVYYQGACPTSSSFTGDTDEGTLGWAHNHLQRSLRRQEVNKLLDRQAGRGQCQACWSVAPLYGCGLFCYGCNSRWCHEYLQSGRQLGPTEVKQQPISWAS